MPRKLPLLLAAVLLLSVLTLPAMAAAPPPAAPPSRMQPGTILLYDENLQPQILQGGYPDEPQTVPAPRLQEIPAGASEAEAKDIRTDNQRRLILYLDQCMGSVPHQGSMTCQRIQCDDQGNLTRVSYQWSLRMVVGMKVEYDGEGCLQNLYYPDPNEPSGYSVRNVPAPIDEGEVPSAAFEMLHLMQPYGALSAAAIQLTLPGLSLLESN